MTLDEAVKILARYQVEGEAPCGGFLDDALKLGIKALNQIKWLHESHVLHDDELLPGETKD